jgi:hypothetical protein
MAVKPVLFSIGFFIVQATGEATGEDQWVKGTDHIYKQS